MRDKNGLYEFGFVCKAKIILITDEHVVACGLG
jgi:hypothetical protein